MQILNLNLLELCELIFYQILINNKRVNEITKT